MARLLYRYRACMNSYFLDLIFCEY